MYSQDLSDRIIIAIGDPNGIGIEIILKALNSEETYKHIKPLIVGCKKSIISTYEELKKQGHIDIANPQFMEIENIPFEGELKKGEPSVKSGHFSFLWLTRAAKLVLEGKGRALVTGPIAKSFWHKSGHYYSGQTERLAEIGGVKTASMLFTAKSPNNNWRFNILLATTHIPFKEIPNNLNREIILSKLDILLEFCKQFNKRPRLIISGLNPHAGEEGSLGSEEIDWLIPSINEWKKLNPTASLEGPLPPDTCWLSAGRAWREVSGGERSPDGFLALYHDQGLIPLKIIAFDSAVNTTLGLPFIRTSPDHGTAFDIAGKGIANPESMIAAINTAWELSKINVI